MEPEPGATPWVPQFAAFAVAVVGLMEVGIGWLERLQNLDPRGYQPASTRAIVSLALGVSAIALEAIPIPRSRRRLGVTIALSLVTVVVAVALLMWVPNRFPHQVNPHLLTAQ